MAIQHEGEQTQSNFGNNGQQQQRQVNTSSQGGSWNFHQQGLIDAPVSAGVGGEYFTKFRQAMVDTFKDIAEGLKIDVLSLNRQNIQGLRFSALVVALRRPEIDANTVAYHTLILEATGDPLPQVQKLVDGQQIYIRHATSDAFDNIMADLVYNAVMEAYPNSHAFNADATVIPSNVSVNIVQGERTNATLENIARNTALACVSTISRATGTFNPLDLTKMDRDCRFEIDVAFGTHQVKDVLGMPVRSSALIAYKSIKKSGQQYSADLINIPDSVAQVCQLSGFLNAIWSPVEQQDQFGFGMYQNPNVPRATQKFAAEFVITNVATPFATSPAAVLFALSSFMTLVDNNTWIQALLPRPGHRGSDFSGGKIDITDIGALNITANIGNDTTKGGFGLPVSMEQMKGDLIEINKYLISLFSPGVSIAMDCPEAGPTSWYMSLFTRAATGDVNAYNELYESLMELTGGNFEKYFKHGTRMFDNVIRIPLGYYKVGDQLLDIRTIDYTAIANVFANNPQLIHDYSNTFVDRPGVSSERNLAMREGILQHAVNDSAVFTGYAARVTWAKELILAYSSALGDCKLPVTVNTPLNADQLRSSVATPDYIRGSLVSGTHTFQNGAPARAAGVYRYGAAFRR